MKNIKIVLFVAKHLMWNLEKSAIFRFLLILCLFSIAAQGQSYGEKISPNDSKDRDPKILSRDDAQQSNGVIDVDPKTDEKDSRSQKVLAPLAGAIDPGLNPTIASSVGQVRCSALQADGKVLMGGYFINISGVAKYNLARFNIDGSIDTSFSPVIGDVVHSVAVQADGKIMIAGAFSFVNGVGRNRIARLNADGSLDTSFNPGGGTDNSVNKVVLQPDGKILIGGFFTQYNGVAQNNIARLNTDGSIDTSFITNADSTVYSIAILTNGNILIGGTFSTINATSHPFFAKLASNGSLDSSVNPVLNSTVRDIALQSDGKILLGGSFTTINGSTRSRIARINADYSLDIGFNPGTGFNATAMTVNPLAGGKILVGGSFTTFNGASRNGLTRLNSDGSLDLLFSVGTGFNGGVVYTTKVLTTGEIGVGGSFIVYNGVSRDTAVVITTDGFLDVLFSITSFYQAFVRAVLVQPDGKIIVAGTFNRVNSQVCGNIARLNADGSFDPTFNSGSGSNAQIYTMAFQNDGSGKFLIGGGFTTYNGVTRNRIARINSDGTLDTTFDGGGANAAVSGILNQGTQTYVGGNYTTIGGGTRPGIARLTANGSLDATFIPAFIPSGSFFEALRVDSNGRLLAGGVFALPGLNSLVRLNPDGSIDNTFVPDTDPNTGIYSMDLQDDGKILIGGTFSSLRGVTQNGVARLNTNGTRDTSFNVGSGTSVGDDVEDIVALPNGKILIGGLITSINAVPQKNIVRLNSDGGVDTSFITTADNTVWNIAVPIATSTGTGTKMLIGGDFFSINSIARTGLARLIVEPGVASISGRVIQQSGRGVTDAVVSFVDRYGVEHSKVTDRMGFYKFDSAQTGVGYTIRVLQRRMQFTSQNVTLSSDITNFDFVAGQ